MFISFTTFVAILRTFIENDFKTVYRQQCWSWLRNLDDDTMEQIEKEVEDRYYPNMSKEERLNAAIEVSH